MAQWTFTMAISAFMLLAGIGNWVILPRKWAYLSLAVFLLFTAYYAWMSIRQMHGHNTKDLPQWINDIALLYLMVGFCNMFVLHFP